MRRKLLIGLGVLVGAPIVIITAALIWIDAVARRGIETATTLALKVPTHLESASLQFSGRATLGRFSINNPARFKEAAAASFESLDARLDPSTLLKDVIKIDQLRIERPELTAEFIGFRSNWSVLMANLAETRSGERRERSKAVRDRRPSGKSFRILRLSVKGASMRFRSNLLPGGSHVVRLAPFELMNIGSEPGGATMAEVLSTLFLAMAAHVIVTDRGGLPGELLGAFKGEVEMTTREIRSAIELGGEHLKQAEKALWMDLQHLLESER